MSRWLKGEYYFDTIGDVANSNAVSESEKTGEEDAEAMIEKAKSIFRAVNEFLSRYLFTWSTLHL